MQVFRSGRRALKVFAIAATATIAGAGGALLGVCGPFTDVSDPAFCPFVLEIFTLGITTGTTPTTYDPTSSVSRLQMAVFLSRTVDGSLRRASRRAALDQYWTPQAPINLGLTSLSTSTGPNEVKWDGEDLWVASQNSGTVSRVHAGDGKLLETWTGATKAFGVLVAMGKVFATGITTPGSLYRIDPSKTAGAVTTVASVLGSGPYDLAFDGSRIWTGNLGPPGSISIVTPTVSLPWTTTTISTGFAAPMGTVYDGLNVWVADTSANALLKLDSSGVVLQTVTVGLYPSLPVFDGTNIWVPNNGFPSSLPSVSVVRPSTGAVLATLTGNGLTDPDQAAFDGERIIVTNVFGGSVSLWKAADLTPLGSVSVGGGLTTPTGVCSNRVNFWVVLSGPNQLARF